MKTTVSVAAVACVTLVALTAPRADVSAYQFGLTGNDWWASQRHHVAAIAPAGLRRLVGRTGAEGHPGKLSRAVARGLRPTTMC